MCVSVCVCVKWGGWDGKQLPELFLVTGSCFLDADALCQVVEMQRDTVLRYLDGGVQAARAHAKHTFLFPCP